jgi:hypothetical protein
MRRASLAARLTAVLATVAPAASAWAATASMTAPSSARIGAAVTVHASGLIKGRYALTLVADFHPARGASCVARIAPPLATRRGAVTLSGPIPRRLVCYQGLATALGPVPTTEGSYHLVVAEPVAPAGFTARGSFLRSALHLTR